MTYLVSQRSIRRSRAYTVVHLVEAGVVIGGVGLLRQTFWVLNGELSPTGVMLLPN